MTMAELYAAPEKLDGGAAMVETIKAEVGKLNVESKEQREAKEKADEFEAFIRNSIKQSEIKHVHTDKYGSKYESISYVTTLDGERIQMITAWIIGHGENAPRLITAYLKPEIKE